MRLRSKKNARAFPNQTTAAVMRGRGRRTRRSSAKILFICLIILVVIFSYIGNKRSQHLLRKMTDSGNLERCDLKSYPLLKMSELEELDLSGCVNLNLPDNPNLWTNLSSLKKLDLNNNQLDSLPQSMQNLMVISTRLQLI